jgi:2'-5' RNA ligase
VWPDEAARSRLDDIARRLRAQLGSGRCVPAANLHLTLAFIGELGDEDARRLAVALAGLATVAPDLQFDRVGSFARARVVWVAGAPHPALLDLGSAVRALLDRERIACDPKPFVPHVTVLRDARGGAAVDGSLDESVTWRSTPAALFRTEVAGGRAVYRRIATVA